MTVSEIIQIISIALAIVVGSLPNFIDVKIKPGSPNISFIQKLTGLTNWGILMFCLFVISFVFGVITTIYNIESSHDATKATDTLLSRTNKSLNQNSQVLRNTEGLLNNLRSLQTESERLNVKLKKELTLQQKLNNDLNTFSKISSANDLRNNDKLERSLNDLSGINERIQYPLPRIIVADLQLKWSVKGVSDPFNGIIKRERKGAIIENISTFPDKFLMDISYNIIPKLYLGFKSINLKFTKRGNVANYHVTLWLNKFVNNFYKFYHPYDINIFKDAYFIYDSSLQTVSLNLIKCPFLLTSISSRMSSLFDLDSSKLSLEINPDHDNIWYELNIEHPADYIFGSGFYNANENHQALIFNAIYSLTINFNEMFEISYHNISARNFVIDTFKLGR